MCDLDRPVFVTGTPRSGKSCVARLLAGSGEFARHVEPVMLWETGMGARADDRRFAREATPQVRERVLAGCQAFLADHPGKRYVDDLSYHALRAQFVHAMFPKGRIIHVIRDGADAIPEILYGWMFRFSPLRAARRGRRHWRNWRDVSHRALRLLKNILYQRLTGSRADWGPRVPGLREFRAHHSVAEVAAFQWCRMVEVAMEDLAALSPDAWLEVRYDRLLTNPKEQARRIGVFCEVHNLDRLVQFAEEYIEKDYVFEKRVQPTPDQWDAIWDLIGPLQQRLGYGRSLLKTA